MITACPACRTAFRITQEQLAAREGRVRCGRCAAVFDARETLQPAESEPETGDRPHPPPAFTEPERSPAESPDVADAGNPWLNPVASAPAPTLAAEQPEPPQAARETEPVFPVAEPVPARHRAGWLAASTLLVIALIAQVAFHYRGEIALLFPQLRPTLAELCTSLACDIPLPRRAELISIESSDLQADPANPNVMVLTATLRNRAAFLQSHPSLELTLTNSQDQPLARRVLGVQDYLGRSTAGAGFAANSELPVRVYMEASSLKATGYRLYLFFP